MKRTSLREKLESGFVRAGPDECWLWTKSIRHKYGGIRCNLRNATISTHRASYEVYVGPIPDGLCVLHQCDNPLCVNPKHLFLGTQLDNIADRHRKGRTVVVRLTGASHPRSKLSPEEVAEIRNLRSQGISLATLSKRFKVRPSGICLICTGKIWKDAPGPITPKKSRHEINKTFAILTEDDIPKIRNKHLGGQKTSQIAREHGVAPRTIRDILNKITWKHVA